MSVSRIREPAAVRFSFETAMFLTML